MIQGMKPVHPVGKLVPIQGFHLMKQIGNAAAERDSGQFTGAGQKKEFVQQGLNLIQLFCPYQLCYPRRILLGAVSYTHLDVYKRQVPTYA